MEGAVEVGGDGAFPLLAPDLAQPHRVVDADIVDDQAELAPGVVDDGIGGGEEATRVINSIRSLMNLL